jgi:hypothetical protein
MILLGDLQELAAEYRASWSGLCRGKPRTAYSIEAEGPRLRFDFVRWLGRRAAKNKEGGVVILKRIEEQRDSGHPEETLSVLVFKGTEAGKTVEQLVAEVAVEIGADSRVPGIAIRLASFRHTASCVRRLGTMRRKFQEAMKTGFGYEWPVAYTYDRKRDEFFFGAQFVAWLRKESLEKEPARVSNN